MYYNSNSTSCSGNDDYNSRTNNISVDYNQIAYSTDLSRNIGYLEKKNSVDIKDMEILVPNKVVKVLFDDNTFEKAICLETDEFNLEDAITVCLAKKYCGGSSKYHNLIEKRIRRYNNKIKEIEKKKEEEKQHKERIERKRLKKQKNKEKALKKKIKTFVEIMTETMNEKLSIVDNSNKGENNDN